MYLHAESVKVDTDEGKLTLEVLAYTNSVDDEQTTFTIDIHGIDLDAFYASVQSGVGGYLRERDEARRTRPVAHYASPDEAFYQVTGEPYDFGDPKHENFHSIHADLHDNREGK